MGIINMQTVSICVLTAKSKAKETQTKSKVGKETLLIGHEQPDFLLISCALVTGTGKSATAVSPNRMPRLPPPLENGFTKSPHAAHSDSKSVHSGSGEQSLGYTLGPSLSVLLEKQATAFTRGPKVGNAPNSEKL